MNKKQGRFVVISGFPASGQDTIVNSLLERHPEFSRIITHTNRPKRPGEVDGVDYHFISTEKFEQMIAGDLFFEHVLHGPYYKGTVKKAIKPVVKGKNIIWKVDITRSAYLEETMVDKLGNNIAQSILARTYKFVLKTENSQEALKRFKNRDLNFDLNEFNKRYLQMEKVFNANLNKFPYIITNKTGSVGETVNQIEEILDQAV